MKVVSPKDNQIPFSEDSSFSIVLQNKFFKPISKVRRSLVFVISHCKDFTKDFTTYQKKEIIFKICSIFNEIITKTHKIFKSFVGKKVKFRKIKFRSFLPFLDFIKMAHFLYY